MFLLARLMRALLGVAMRCDCDWNQNNDDASCFSGVSQERRTRSVVQTTEQALVGQLPVRVSWESRCGELRRWGGMRNATAVGLRTVALLCTV